MKSKILILASSGSLGSNLFFFLKKKKFIVKGFNKKKLDITSSNFENKINSFKPNIIINCAAYTDVIKSEIYFKKAKKINYDAVVNIANYCKSNNIYLIHYSSDYVFNGKRKKKYIENNKMSPINAYGKTKYLADNYLIKQNIDSIIIRTSSIISGEKNCFLKKIYELIKSNKDIYIDNNIMMNPTFIDDLVFFTYQLIERNFLNKKGLQIFNYTNKNSTTWYKLAKKFIKILNKNSNTDFKLSKLKKNIKNINNLKRPANSSLSIKKVSLYKFKINTWESALFKIVMRLKKNDV